MIVILSISLILLALLKSQELMSLQPYRRGQASLKIEKFAKAKKNLSPSEQSTLGIWESILTGRSAVLSSSTKTIYADLGLRHLFTPSGFHLSAVLRPFLKFSSSAKLYLSLLAIIGIALFFLPGLGALKRMVLVKGAQRITSTKSGFVLALLLDVLWGSFQGSALSFSYSFLFLGIIYSGVRGIGLVFWFFVGQILLAYFQGNMISPLLLLWAPLLNLVYGLAMPLLFLLALPLCSWQLKSGLCILEGIQKVVLIAADSLKYVPVWEIHSGMLILVACFLFKRWKIFILVTFLLSHSVNLETEKIPSLPAYDFRPQGEMTKVKGDVVFFNDGKCKMKLVHGFWWEKCSPIRKSTRKRTKKLSYPSSELEKFSPHGWST
jgi:hypothetical protein